MALQKNNDVISIELQRLKVRLLSAECEPPLLRVYSPCRAIDLEIDKIKRTNGRRVKCQVNVWVIAVVEPVDGSQALAKFAYRPCTEFVNVFSLNLVFWYKQSDVLSALPLLDLFLNFRGTKLSDLIMSETALSPTTCEILPISSGMRTLDAIQCMAYSHTLRHRSQAYIMKLLHFLQLWICLPLGELFIRL